MRLLVVFYTLVITSLGQAQTLSRTNERELYDKIIKGDTEPSLKQILGYSKSRNSYNFMAMGYFFNANNLMYQKTKDIKYLEYNFQVVDNLISEKNVKSNYLKNRWPIAVAKNHMSANHNDQESLVYEGYFFRYLAEFYDILVTSNIYINKHAEISRTLKYAYDKWAEPSNKKFGDESSLYHIRLHIGSHWATIAMYLHKHSAEQKYLKFYNDFNQQLIRALKTKKISGKTCYVWNSTYPDLFNFALKRSGGYKPVLQDVSHGNHVVQFIIDSYGQGYGDWKKTDLQRLANTVKYLLWQPNNQSFADMVDGTKSTDKTFVGEGWKQSDGWMKLMAYDSSLKNIYKAFFNANENRILKRFQGLQTLAVLYSNPS